MVIRFIIQHDIYHKGAFQNNVRPK